MTNIFCKSTTTHYELKAGTKTAYVQVGESMEEFVDKQYHTNCVTSAPFMRRLGGSEHLAREYTKRGYLVTRIISKSPNKQNKTIREFDFDV